MQRKIKNIYKSFQDNIADLKTVRPIPSPLIDMIDPFLFLNHHGPQVYPSNNRGLPFGPHPHRGFQTVTFILDGDITHRDSAGHDSVIGPGGAQWMSAGKGLIHEEVSSSEFKKQGGALEVLQLWINLPARLKMSEPYYKGLQKNELPVLEKDNGKVKIQVLAGPCEKIRGPFQPSTEISLFVVEIHSQGHYQFQVPAGQNIFFYVVRGEIDIQGQAVKKMNLVEFENEGDFLSLKGAPDALILIGFAEPFREPVISRGPFVMNTELEIKQAIDDYQRGQF